MAFVFVLLSRIFSYKDNHNSHGDMMIVSNIDVPYSFNVTFKPNSALTANGKLKVLLLIAMVPCLIGVAFAFLGAWIILPFVGLELIALIYAFYYINMHEADYESISIENNVMTIERCVSESVTKDVLNAYWIKIVKHELANGELHLYVQSHGKKIEVGRYLTRKQRELLARQLEGRSGLFNRN